MNRYVQNSGSRGLSYYSYATYAKNSSRFGLQLSFSVENLPILPGRASELSVSIDPDISSIDEPRISLKYCPSLSPYELGNTKVGVVIGDRT